MPTNRDAIADAMRALRVLAPGNDPDADELTVALGAAQDLIWDIHDARGPLLDVDVTASLVCSENQRIRVQAGFNITVTLPNAVPLWGNYDPYDYGFTASQQEGAIIAPTGTTASADGVQYRQPRDGARIEIVGTTQALYFYRADLNQWMSADTIAMDDEMVFNARYRSAYAAMIAGKIMDVVANAEPSAGLQRRIQQGNAALMMQSGTKRDPVRAQYF